MLGGLGSGPRDVETWRCLLALGKVPDTVVLLDTSSKSASVAPHGDFTPSQAAAAALRRIRQEGQAPLNPSGVRLLALASEAVCAPVGIMGRMMAGGSGTAGAGLGGETAPEDISEEEEETEGLLEAPITAPSGKAAPALVLLEETGFDPTKDVEELLGEDGAENDRDIEGDAADEEEDQKSNPLSSPPARGLPLRFPARSREELLSLVREAGGDEEGEGEETSDNVLETADL